MLSLAQELEAFASSNALQDVLLLRGDAVGLPGQSAGWTAVKALLGAQEVMDTNGLSSSLFLFMENKQFLEMCII